ncbi:MAG: hypothetical protein ACR2PO_15105, partial [Methyloligellaceae bacterium]
GADASSEHLLSAMSSRIGKHRAQEMLQEIYRKAREEGQPLETLLEEVATDLEITELSQVDLGASGLMVDRVVEAAGRRRSSESEGWP